MEKFVKSNAAILDKVDFMEKFREIESLIQIQQAEKNCKN